MNSEDLYRLWTDTQGCTIDGFTGDRGLNDCSSETELPLDLGLPGDSPEGRAYWDALQYIARWTQENHALIHEALLRRLGQRALVQIGNEHNFVWKRGDSFLHGKGATPAWQDSAAGQALPDGLVPAGFQLRLSFAHNVPGLSSLPMSRMARRDLRRSSSFVARFEFEKLVPV